MNILKHLIKATKRHKKISGRTSITNDDLVNILERANMTLEANKHREQHPNADEDLLKAINEVAKEGTKDEGYHG